MMELAFLYLTSTNQISLLASMRRRAGLSDLVLLWSSYLEMHSGLFGEIMEHLERGCAVSGTLGSSSGAGWGSRWQLVHRSAWITR